MGYVTFSYSCCRRVTETCYFGTERPLHVMLQNIYVMWNSKSMLIFVHFPSSGFNPFLQRETAIGVILGSVQKESSCVLAQQKTIHFLVCAFLVGSTNSVGLSLLPASLCSDLMAGLRLLNK